MRLPVRDRHGVTEGLTDMRVGILGSGAHRGPERLAMPPDAPGRAVSHSSGGRSAQARDQDGLPRATMRALPDRGKVL
jgi:hypothetical protein